MKVPNGGGAEPMALASLGARFPASLAVSGGKVYFTDGALWMVSTGGGGLTRLAPDASSGVAASATDVVWASSQGALMSEPLSGIGAPVTLASGQGAPYSIAVSGTKAYFTAPSYSGLLSVPLAGGIAPVTLSTDANEAPIATDGTNVYFTDATGDVLMVPVGSVTITVLATGQYPVSFAVDSVNLYWTSGGDNVMQMRKP